MSSYGYQDALAAAGANVAAFEAFGSYQGTWIARVDTGFVSGSYGSCSGCDAFEAEFGWYWEEQPDAKERLAAFGAIYLEDVLSYEQILAKVKEDEAWDSEVPRMIEFIEANK